MAGRLTRILSLRTTTAEATMVRVVAESAGMSVSEALREIVLPAARERLAKPDLAGEGPAR